jgi:hypothetical protein
LKTHPNSSRNYYDYLTVFLIDLNDIAERARYEYQSIIEVAAQQKSSFFKHSVWS